MKTPRNLALIFFLVWTVAALAVLAPVTRLLKGSFPFFTVLWIGVPLVAVLVWKTPAKVGFSRVAGRELLVTTVTAAAALLLLMLAFEPWSHTYQKLIALALAGPVPDTTFAWLVRYPRVPALTGMFFYSGLVTLFGEELFFRGWLLQLFKRRMGGRAAVLLQAALFVLPNLPAALVLPPLQGALYAVIYTFAGIGLIGGWAASKTDSIWPGLIMAALSNLVFVALVF